MVLHTTHQSCLPVNYLFWAVPSYFLPIPTIVQFPITGGQATASTHLPSVAGHEHKHALGRAAVANECNLRSSPCRAQSLPRIAPPTRAGLVSQVASFGRFGHGLVDAGLIENLEGEVHGSDVIRPWHVHIAPGFDGFQEQR